MIIKDDMSAQLACVSMTPDSAPHPITASTYLYAPGDQPISHLSTHTYATLRNKTTMCPAAVGSSVARASRWCPTGEQVKLLEELYKGGLTNPNAGQIHQIVAHLSRFGKVQGKNVFYWFQNHKARDKQRVRKKLVGRSEKQMVELLRCGNSPGRYAQYLCKPEIGHHQCCSNSSIKPVMVDARCGCWGGVVMELRHGGGRTSRTTPLPRCDDNRITLDLFPVTPGQLRKQGEASDQLSCNFSLAGATPRLLPNPNLSLGLPAWN